MDARWLRHAHAEIPAGAAVAGMLLNGLGGAHRPVAFPPQGFANKPLELLLHEGVRAEMVHRLPRGRTLDAVHA